MLVSLLSRKNMTIYALSKKSGVAYSTLNYIVNGKTPYEKCSISTFKKIADALEMSMNELYEECNYTIDDFEVFKSNVGHRIKEIGQLDFIEEILLSDILEKYWKEGKEKPIVRENYGCTSHNTQAELLDDFVKSLINEILDNKE